jgi:hypothetical protein
MQRGGGGVNFVLDDETDRVAGNGGNCEHLASL